MKEFDFKEEFSEWFEGCDEQEREKLVAQEKVLFMAADAIYQAIQEQQIGKSELAELVGKKPAFITRVLKGDHNITLKTLAELAAALNREVVVQLKEKYSNGFVWEGFQNKENIIPFPSSNTRTVKVNDFKYG